MQNENDVIQHIKNAQGLIAKKRDSETQAAFGELTKALQKAGGQNKDAKKKEKFFKPTKEEITE